VFWYSGGFFVVASLGQDPSNPPVSGELWGLNATRDLYMNTTLLNTVSASPTTGSNPASVPNPMFSWVAGNFYKSIAEGQVVSPCETPGLKKSDCRDGGSAGKKPGGSHD
jgi:hypothetical protein